MQARSPGIGWRELGGHALAVLVIAVFAFGLVWQVGFEGFMPLDQSIVWDGGWRIASGQQPFTDFLLPAGLTPAAIQAVLFRLWGVSWGTYVAHAAGANALFSLMVYAVLCRLFDKPWQPLLYALLTGMVLYPPVGTPYLDQHAIIFATVTIVLVLWDVTGPQPAAFRWFLVPAALALAFLSKQTPAAVALCWTLCVVLRLHTRWRYPGGTGLIWLFVGWLTVVVVGSAALATWAEPFNVWLSLVDLPADTGRLRVSLAYMAGRARHLGEISFVPLLAVLGLQWRSLLTPQRNANGRTDFALHAAATGLIGLFVIFVLTSDNSRWFAFGGIPLAAGLAHALARRVNAVGWQRYLGPAIALTLTFEMGLMHIQSTSPHAGNDLHRADWNRAVDAGPIDSRLAGLDWITPPTATDVHGAEDSADGYRALLSVLRTRPGNFLIVGDATILYALAGAPSAFPALWFHPGLTYPLPDDPARRHFDAMISTSLARFRVRWLIVDGNSTWAGTSMEDFVPLATCAARATSSTAIGHFRVLEVPEGCSIQPK